MSITATELKNNLSEYLSLASTQDIYITKYGKVVAKLTVPFESKEDLARSLIGSIPSTRTKEESMKERREKILRNNGT